MIKITNNLLNQMLSDSIFHIDNMVHCFICNQGLHEYETPGEIWTDHITYDKNNNPEVGMLIEGGNWHHQTCQECPLCLGSGFIYKYNGRYYAINQE